MLTDWQLRRNLRAYYFSRIDVLSLIIVGVIQIWLNHGLSFSQILLLQGLFGLFILLLEFPSGVWADLTSRKNLLVIGNLAIIAGTFTYMLAASYFMFVLAELFYAIGIAMRSGANSAHIYDSYLMVGQQGKGDEILANGSILTMGAMVVLVSLGGFLYVLNNYLPFIVSMAASMVGIALYVVSIEPDRKRMESSSQAVKQALQVLQSSSMLQLLLVFMFSAVYLKTAFWAYIPKLEVLEVDEIYHGLVLAGANVVAFSSSLLLKRSSKGNRLLDGLLVIGALGLGLFLVNNSLLLMLLAIAMHQVVRGGINLLLSIKVNQGAPSEVRASLISLISSIGFAVYFVLSIIFEYLALNQDTILLLNALFAVATIGLIGVLRLHLQFLQPKPLEVMAD